MNAPQFRFVGFAILVVAALAGCVSEPRVSSTKPTYIAGDVIVHGPALTAAQRDFVQERIRAFAAACELTPADNPKDAVVVVTAEYTADPTQPEKTGTVVVASKPNSRYRYRVYADAKEWPRKRPIQPGDPYYDNSLYERRSASDDPPFDTPRPTRRN